jgi:hypothetical protein
VALNRLIVSRERYSFLSEQLKMIRRSSLSKPFGFGSERLSSGFPLRLLSSDASPHQLHLSVPVKMPVSNLDCDAILHQLNFMSSRKYFNFCPYFTGISWISCG